MRAFASQMALTNETEISFEDHKLFAYGSGENLTPDLRLTQASIFL